MGNLELPADLEGLFHFLSGMEWPRMDTDRMYRLAEVYRNTADELRSQVPQLLDSAVDTMTGYFQLSATDPFVAAMRQFTDGSPNYLEQMATAADQLAEFVRNASAQAEYTKWMIIAQLTELAAEIAYAIAMAPFTFGASLAELPILYAIGRALLRTLFSALLRAIVAHTALGAALGVAMDQIIQRIQIAQGHRDHVDSDLTLMSLESGALGGALGPVLGKLGGGLSSGLGRALGTDLGAAAGDALGRTFGDAGARLGRDLGGTLPGSLGRGRAGADALAAAGAAAFDRAFGDRLGGDAARSLGRDYGRTLAERWGRDDLGAALADALGRGGHLGTGEVAALSRDLPAALADALARRDGTAARAATWLGNQAIASATNYAQGMLSDGLYNLIFSPEHSFTADWGSGTSAMGAGWLHAAAHGLGDRLHLTAPHLSPVPGVDPRTADGVASGSTDGFASGDGDGVASGSTDGVAPGSSDGFASGDGDGVAYGDGFRGGSAGDEVPASVRDAFDDVFGPVTDRPRPIGTDPVTGPLDDFRGRLVDRLRGRFEAAGARAYAEHAASGEDAAQPGWVAHLDRLAAQLPGHARTVDAVAAPIEARSDRLAQATSDWQHAARAQDPVRHERFGLADRLPSPEALGRARHRLFGDLGERYRQSFPDGIEHATDEQLAAWRHRAGDTLDRVPDLIATEVARDVAHQLPAGAGIVDGAAFHRDVDELFDRTVAGVGPTDPVAFDRGMQDLLARHGGTAPPIPTTDRTAPTAQQPAPAAARTVSAEPTPPTTSGSQQPAHPPVTDDRPGTVAPSTPPAEVRPRTVGASPSNPPASRTSTSDDQAAPVVPTGSQRPASPAPSTSDGQAAGVVPTGSQRPASPAPSTSDDQAAGVVPTGSQRPASPAPSTSDDQAALVAPTGSQRPASPAPSTSDQSGGHQAATSTRPQVAPQPPSSAARLSPGTGARTASTEPAGTPPGVVPRPPSAAAASLGSSRTAPGGQPHLPPATTGTEPRVPAGATSTESHVSPANAAAESHVSPGGTNSSNTRPGAVSTEANGPAGTEPAGVATAETAPRTASVPPSDVSRRLVGTPPSAPPRPNTHAERNDGPGVPPAIPVDQPRRLDAYRQGNEDDRHWVPVEREDGSTEYVEQPWRGSDVAALRDRYGTVPLTPNMVRKWFADNGKRPPDADEIRAVLYPNEPAPRHSYDIDDPDAFARAARDAGRRQRFQGHLDGQREVLDSVHGVTDWITDRFPPDRYVYVGLGRSPAPLIAALRSAGYQTGTVPLSEFRPPAPRDSVLARALPAVDRDGRPVPDFTEQTRNTLDEHLADFLGDLPPDRDILLLDYTESGRSLVAAQQHVQQYRQRTGAGGDVEALAVHEDIQSGNLHETIARVADPARTEPRWPVRGALRTLDHWAGNTPARTDWSGRFHTLMLGDGKLPAPYREGRAGDALIGPNFKALAQAMKKEAFDGLAEYGSFPILRHASRPARGADRQPGHDVLSDALAEVRPRTESRRPDDPDADPRDHDDAPDDDTDPPADPPDDHDSDPPTDPPDDHADPPVDRSDDERDAQPPADRSGDERDAQPPADRWDDRDAERSDDRGDPPDGPRDDDGDPAAVDVAAPHRRRLAETAPVYQRSAAWADPTSDVLVRSGFELRRFADGDDGVVELTVRMRYDADGIDAAALDRIRRDLAEGVRQVFNAPGHRLRTGPTGDRLVVRVTEDARGPVHLRVRAVRDQPRMTQLEWPVGRTPAEYAHELGHQLGLRDEPAPGSLMGGLHDRPHDAALAPAGLRDRHLDLIGRQIGDDVPVHRYAADGPSRLPTIPAETPPHPEQVPVDPEPRGEVLAATAYRPVPLRLPSGAALPDYLHTMYGATTPTLRHLDTVVAEATRRLGLPDEVRDALAATLRDRAQWLADGYPVSVRDAAGVRHELTVRANPHGTLRELDTAAPAKVETAGEVTSTRSATATSSERLRLAVSAAIGPTGPAGFAVRPELTLTHERSHVTTTSDAVARSSTVTAAEDAPRQFAADAWYRFGYRAGGRRADVELGIADGMRLRVPEEIAAPPTSRRLPGTLPFGAAERPTVGVSGVRAPHEAVRRALATVAPRTDPGHPAIRRFLDPDRLAQRLPALLHGPIRIPGTHVTVTATAGTGRLVHHDDTTAVRAETTTTGTTKRDVTGTRSAQAGIGAGAKFGALAASMRAMLVARHRRTAGNTVTFGGSGGRRSGTETAGATGAYRTPVTLELRDARTGATARIDDAEALLRVGEHEARRIADWHDGRARPQRPPNPPEQLTEHHPRGLSSTTVLGVDEHPAHADATRPDPQRRFADETIRRLRDRYPGLIADPDDPASAGRTARDNLDLLRQELAEPVTSSRLDRLTGARGIPVRLRGDGRLHQETVTVRLRAELTNRRFDGTDHRLRHRGAVTAATVLDAAHTTERRTEAGPELLAATPGGPRAVVSAGVKGFVSRAVRSAVTLSTGTEQGGTAEQAEHHYSYDLRLTAEASTQRRIRQWLRSGLPVVGTVLGADRLVRRTPAAELAAVDGRVRLAVPAGLAAADGLPPRAPGYVEDIADTDPNRLRLLAGAPIQPPAGHQGLLDGTYRVEQVADADLVAETAERLVASVTHTEPDLHPADTVADEFGTDRIAGELARALDHGRTVTGLHHRGVVFDRRARLVVESRLDTDSLTPASEPTTGLPISTKDSVDVSFGDTTTRTAGVSAEAQVSLRAPGDGTGAQPTGSVTATAGRSRVHTTGHTTTVRAAQERTYRGSTVAVRGDLVHQLHAVSRRTGVLPGLGRLARDSLGPLVGYAGGSPPEYAGARVVSPGGGLLRLPTGTARRLGALPAHPADLAPATRPPRYEGFRAPDAEDGRLSVSFPHGVLDTAAVLDAVRESAAAHGVASLASHDLLADVSGNLDRLATVLAGPGIRGLAPMLARHGVTLGVDNGGVLRLRTGTMLISLEPHGSATMTGLVHDTRVAESLAATTRTEDGRQVVDVAGAGTGIGVGGGTGETPAPVATGTVRSDGATTGTAGATVTDGHRRQLSLGTDEPLVRLSQPVRLRVEVSIGGHRLQAEEPAGTLHAEVPLSLADLADAPRRPLPQPHPVHRPAPTDPVPTARVADDDRIGITDDSFPQRVHHLDAIRAAAGEALRAVAPDRSVPRHLLDGMLSDPVLRATLPDGLATTLRDTAATPVRLDTQVFLHRRGARLLRVGGGRTPGAPGVAGTDEHAAESTRTRQDTALPAVQPSGTAGQADGHAAAPTDGSGESVAPTGIATTGGDTATGATTKQEVTGGVTLGGAEQRMYLFRLPATWRHEARPDPQGPAAVTELHSPAGVDVWLTEPQARRAGLLTDENLPAPVRAAADTTEAAAERWRGHATRYETARAHLDVAEAERAEQRAAYERARAAHDRLAADRDAAAAEVAEHVGTGGRTGPEHAEARHARLVEQAGRAHHELRAAREALRDRDAHVAATLYELADARAAAERAAAELTAATRAERAMVDWYGTPAAERTGTAPGPYRLADEPETREYQRYQRPDPDDEVFLDPAGTPYLRAADWPARDSQLAALHAALSGRIGGLDTEQLRTTLARRLRTDDSLADFAVPDRDERFAPAEVTEVAMDERARAEYDDTGQLPDELGTAPPDAAVRAGLAAASLLRGGTDPRAYTGGDLAVAAAANAYRVPIRVVRDDLGFQDFGPPAGPGGPDVVLHVDADGHYRLLHRLAGPVAAPPAWQVRGTVLTSPDGAELAAAPVGRDLVPALTAALAARYPERAGLLGPPPPHPAGDVAGTDPVTGRLVGAAGPGEAAYRLGVPITVVHPDGSTERFGPATPTGLVLYRDGAGRYHPTAPAPGSAPTAPRQRTVGDPLDASTGIPETSLDALLRDLFETPVDAARRDAAAELLALPDPVPDGEVTEEPLARLADTVFGAAGTAAAGDGRALLVELAAALRADRLPVTVSSLTGQADDWRRRYPELFRGPARSLADEVAGLLRGGSQH